MRWFHWLFLIPVLFLVACSDGHDMGAMQKKGGKYYLKKAKFPFSGQAVAYFPSKKGEERRILEQGRLQGGLREGEWVAYKWNGEWSEIPYRKGRRHGEMIVYHPNGNKKSTQEYENGKPDGVGTFFDASGDPVRHVYYVDGARKPLPEDAEGDILKKVEKLFGIFSDGFSGGGSGE